MDTTTTKATAEQAFEQLHQSETRYRNAQEHLVKTKEQFRQNRKAIELAKQEADDLNQEWKTMLRDNHGKTNKTILEKLEASRNARDVALELEPILESAPEILEAAEVEAITARKSYIRDLKAAQGAMLTFEMTEATEAVQQLPEFNTFIFTLSQYVKHHQAYQRKEAWWSITGSEDQQSGAATADDLKAIEALANGRTCAHLMEVMRLAGLNDDVDGIEELKGLKEIPESIDEKASPMKRSNIALMQARKRLAKSA